MALEQEKLEKGSSNSTTHSGFDPIRNMHFVPKFEEVDVDKYFSHFEKIAISLNWPKESWSLMLQSAFIGKAREIYVTLSVDQCRDYDFLKQSILKAYELVPEAYRQKFRSARKQSDQTHVEFARVKEQMFDRWLCSKDVKQDFTQLRQLVLIEEFKRCVHADIKTHLDERDVNTLQDAATSADDYALTHKLSSNNSGSNKFGQNNKGHRPNQNRTSQNEGSTREGNAQSGPSNQGNKGPSSGNKVPSNKSGDDLRSTLKCNYCKKIGHLKTSCWKLLGKEMTEKQESSPTGCAVSMRHKVSSQTIKQKVVESEKIREDFEPFVLEGSVSLNSDQVDPVPIKIMRDTCCSQSMIVEGTLPFNEITATGENVLIQGIGMEVISVPLHKMNLTSELVSGTVTVGVRPELPVKGVSMLLGNDLAGGKVLPEPIVTRKPHTLIDSDDNYDITFPACAVTRSMTRKAMLESSSAGGDQVPNFDLEDSFMTKLDVLGHLPSSGEKNSPTNSVSEHEQSGDNNNDPLSHSRLVIEQENDPELKDLGQRVLTPQECEEVPVCFYKQNGVLMRKFRPPDAQANDEWKVVHQIVVPKVYHNQVISIAHESPMAGHLGIRKTHDKILSHFWWPTLRKDVSEFCRSCHTCQVVGKPNQKIPTAPLKPIPAFDEPFSRVIIDCVGPLPKTKSGNQYLLTIMCASTRFPEAIPLRNIKAQTIVKALTKFFTLVGLPKSIQSDQGSNFTSGLFQQVMYELGIEQYTSSAYHPESQGALERFHQTLKNMIRAYTLEFEKDWDEGVHLLLFAAREAVQESLGFSPFELVFGRTVRGPLKLLKEKWLNDEDDTNLLDYVSKFKCRLTRANEIARQNLKEAQTRMKKWYDKSSKDREFKPGDKVLVLFPIPGHPLQARYHGPYVVESKVGEVDYIVKTPDRRKSRQLCHINMLKKYIERSDNVTTQPVCSIGPIQEGNHNDEVDQVVNSDGKQHEYPVKLQNSDVLANLDDKLSHLPEDEKCELKQIIHEWEDIFPDVPSRTNVAFHDIDICKCASIIGHSCRFSSLSVEHNSRKRVNICERITRLN